MSSENRNVINISGSANKSKIIGGNQNLYSDSRKNPDKSLEEETIKNLTSNSSNFGKVISIVLVVAIIIFYLLVK